MGYHIAMGGGVLNRGSSTKDLDLYILPCVGERNNEIGMLNYLAKVWGTADTIGTSVSDAVSRPEWAIYSHKLKYESRNGRIDVFVVKKPDLRHAKAKGPVKREMQGV